MEVLIRRTHPKRTQRARLKGVVAIEFAIGFLAFWMICLVWMEMSYIAYVSALGDVMITKASSYAKRGETGFKKAFDDTLKDQDSIWSYLVSQSNFKTSIRYVKTFDGLAAVTDFCEDECDKPDTTKGEKAPIAIYQVTYDYTPIFATFLLNRNADTETDSPVEKLFSREMIVIQESQLE